MVDLRLRHSTPDPEKFPDDRPRGFLTEADRKYLRGPPHTEIKPKSHAERRARQRIRERMYNALLDFTLVFDQMEDRDLHQIFMRDEMDELIALRNGLTDTLAFIYYNSFGFRPGFETMLERGVAKAEQRLVEPGYRDVEVDFSVEEVSTRLTYEELAEIVRKVDDERMMELTERELRLYHQFLRQSRGLEAALPVGIIEQFVEIAEESERTNPTWDHPSEIERPENPLKEVCESQRKGEENARERKHDKMKQFHDKRQHPKDSTEKNSREDTSDTIQPYEEYTEKERDTFHGDDMEKKIELLQEKGILSDDFDLPDDS